jgi:hypothetical protein
MGKKFFNLMGNSDVDLISTDFNLNLSLFVNVTVENKVEIRENSDTFPATLVRTIGNNNAVIARWDRDNIEIVTNDGKFELRKITGELISVRDVDSEDSHQEKEK